VHVVSDGEAEMPGERSEFRFYFGSESAGTEQTNLRTQFFNASVG